MIGHAVAGEGHSAIRADGTVEATGFVGVAGGAHGVALQEEGVAIAIDADLLHMQDIAGSLAFAPQLLPGTRPEARDLLPQGDVE